MNTTESMMNLPCAEVVAPYSDDETSLSGREERVSHHEIGDIGLAPTTKWYV